MTAPALPRISDYVHRHARERPDAVALVLDDDRVSWRELALRVDALARALIAAGVQPGDRVATLQTPCPAFIVAYVASASIGAIWCGLNPRYTQGELLHPVRDSRPKVLLTRLRIEDRAYGGEVAALQAVEGVERVVGYDPTDLPGVEPFAAFLARGGSVSDAALAARRAGAGGRQGCLLVYTSGTTGQPKGAVLHQQGIIDFALQQNRLWPVEDYGLLNFLPINHVGCTVDMATPMLVEGGKTVFMEHFDADRSMDLMERERITAWGGIPTTLALQLQALERRPRDLSAVKLILYEGAAISEDVLRRLATICPRLATNYGQTESTSAVAATPPTSDFDVLLNSVGGPFPGVELKLVDADGREAAVGEAGEILARSPYLFLGYWNRPEATAATLDAEGFLHTGDVGVMRPDGRLKIVGRIKEMFKSGGYNVYPREVEGVLESHPQVVEAVVVARPDAVWQEVGVAFVTVSGPCDPAELLAFARTRLANYKLPKSLSVEAAFPLLPNGKIDRTGLRTRAAAEG